MLAKYGHSKKSHQCKHWADTFAAIGSNTMLSFGDEGSSRSFPRCAVRLHRATSVPDAACKPPHPTASEEQTERTPEPELDVAASEELLQPQQSIQVQRSGQRLDVRLREPFEELIVLRVGAGKTSAYS